MLLQIVLTLAPTLVAVVVAIYVPRKTFEYALNQARIDRLYDQRAQLYVDILTEAYAEKKYFEFEIESDETRERLRPRHKDLHLPELERARLGARGTAFASLKVNGLLNRLQGLALLDTLVRPKHEGERAVARLRVFDAFTALEDQVRLEFRTDDLEPK